MSVPCLGVDPGSRSGAAVLLDAGGERVLAWWVWVWMERKVSACYRCRTARMRTEWETSKLWHVGHAINRLALDEVYDDCQLVIEGLYVGRRDGSLDMQSVLALAESVGEFRAGLGWTGGLPELRPIANAWRKQVLGLPARTKRAAAEAHAVKWAPRLYDWSGAPWEAHKLTKEERGALAEAACMARWGINQRRYNPELREALAPLT